MVLGNPYSVCILFRVQNSIFLIPDHNVSDIIPLTKSFPWNHLTSFYKLIKIYLSVILSLTYML